MTTPRAPVLRSRHSIFSPAMALMIAAFIVTRLWVLVAAPVQQNLTSTGLFMLTGYEFREALATGQSVYAIHARHAQELADAAGRQGRPIDPARAELEYPPLCAAWLALPTLFAPPGPLDHPSAAQIDAADNALRWMIAAADVITFALLIALHEPLAIDRRPRLWRLGFYILGGLILFNVLYDRFDLVMTMLILLALWLLISRVHWLAAMAVLAIAINFKLVPIILLPVFAIGATRADALSSGRRFLGSILVRSIILLAMCAAIFAPFLARDGAASLGFLHYHAERGLQIESIPATVALLASRGIKLVYTHGATEVAGGSTGTLAAISTILALVAIATVTLMMLIWTRRLPAPSKRKSASLTLAQAHPRAIVFFSLLMLFAAMAPGKVFSPQYLLWLLPLMALLPLRSRTWSGFALMFLVICGLTTAIFPYLYFSQIVRPVIAPPTYALLPPTALGLGLLTARNGLFVLMLILLGAFSSGSRRAAAWDPLQRSGALNSA